MTKSPYDESQPSPFARPCVLRSLNRAQAFEFKEIPNAQENSEIAEFLGLRNVGKMRLTGTLEPIGDIGWLLKAELGASVTQNCVITLALVKTRIDTRLQRKFLPQTEELPDELDISEVEDEDIDPLSDMIDLGKIALEELAMALPLYPKAKDADLAAFAEAQNVVINPPKENPFDVLKSLQKKPSQTD